MDVVKGIGFAVLGAVWLSAAAPAQAQGAGGLGPAEAPPEGFSGATYVDSRGCIFERAGAGWDLRAGQMRAAICGGAMPAPLLTTASTRGQAAGCSAIAAATRHVAGCRPRVAASSPRSDVLQVAPLDTRPTSFLPRRSGANRQLVVPVTVSAGAIDALRLTPSAFLARQIEMREGRTMFTGGAQRLGFGRAREGVPIIVPPARSTFDVTRPPPGYRVAWRDGRLNPLRGPRTLLGDLQSQAVWTTDSPQRLRPAILRRVRR